MSRQTRSSSSSSSTRKSSGSEADFKVGMRIVANSPTYKNVRGTITKVNPVKLTFTPDGTDDRRHVNKSNVVILKEEKPRKLKASSSHSAKSSHSEQSRSTVSSHKSSRSKQASIKSPKMVRQEPKYHHTPVVTDNEGDSWYEAEEEESWGAVEEEAKHGYDDESMYSAATPSRYEGSVSRTRATTPWSSPKPPTSLVEYENAPYYPSSAKPWSNPATPAYVSDDDEERFRVGMYIKVAATATSTVRGLTGRIVKVCPCYIFFRETHTDDERKVMKKNVIVLADRPPKVHVSDAAIQAITGKLLAKAKRNRGAGVDLSREQLRALADLANDYDDQALLDLLQHRD